MSIEYEVTSPRAQDDPTNESAIDMLRIPVTALPMDEPISAIIRVSPDEITDLDPWDFEIHLLEQESGIILAKSPLQSITPDLAPDPDSQSRAFAPITATLVVNGRFTRSGLYRLTFLVNGNETRFFTLIVHQRAPSWKPGRYSVLEPQ